MRSSGPSARNAGASTRSPNVNKLRIYLDSDVVVAGAQSSTGASHLLLKLCELGLIEGVISDQVTDEVEAVLMRKLPQAIPAYRIIRREANLDSVPAPHQRELGSFAGQAKPEDLPHLASATLASCHYLVTHNTKDYRPESMPPEIIRPGDLLRRIREHLLEAAPVDPS